MNEKKTADQFIDEMSNQRKEAIINNCFEFSTSIHKAVHNLNNLSCWFDTYICSDEFAKKSNEEKKGIVKDFRDLYCFLEILEDEIQTELLS